MKNNMDNHSVNASLEKSGILKWVRSSLAKNQYNVNSIEIVQDNPWSLVAKFQTNKGNIYLKRTPPSLFIETDILQLLDSKHDVHVPKVIDVNKNLNCFLMNDCGQMPLRAYFNGKLQTDILIKGIQELQAIQKASIPLVNKFINIGVPDWRLEHYPDLYQSLINETDFLLTNGLTEIHIQQLNEIYPTICNLSNALSDYHIPDTLSHSDFHDNNILIDKETGTITIIDLGETVIENPLFCARACLKNCENRYSLNPEHPDYIKIRDAGLKPWLKDGIDQADYNKLFSIVNRLLPIHLTFGHVRLMKSTVHDELQAIERMRSRLKDGLEWFLNANKR